METPNQESMFASSSPSSLLSPATNTLSSLSSGINQSIGNQQEQPTNRFSWIVAAPLIILLIAFLLLVFIKREKTVDYIKEQVASIQGFWATQQLQSQQLQSQQLQSHSLTPSSYEKPSHLNSIDEVHVDTTVTGPNSNSIEVSKDVDVDVDVAEINIEPDDSYSRIQVSKSSGKKGWCYVGEDRTFRSCVEVGENDKCMSGDIFPTKEICENPSLRP